MKTVKKGDDVRRVEDTQAHMLVNNGWEYCSKELIEQTNQNGYYVLKSKV